MKNLLKPIIYLLFISQIFAIAGFGVYGDYDLLKHYGATSSNDMGLSIETKPFQNAYGVGGYLYIDALPIIDLELSVETTGNLHETIFAAPLLNDFEGDLPWGRGSAYATIRKKIFGLSIPFLAKAKLHAGGGMNIHKVTPEYSLELLQDAFPDSELEEIFDLMEGDSKAITTFGNHVAENMNSVTGGHVQAGLQARLLMLDLFLNARYTIAKDVIPDKMGFPSLWLGIGMGF